LALLQARLNRIGKHEQRRNPVNPRANEFDYAESNPKEEGNAYGHRKDGRPKRQLRLRVGIGLHGGLHERYGDGAPFLLKSCV
jgi:hypothetical protein